MITLNELLAQFAAERMGQGRQRTTVLVYVRHVERFAAWYADRYGVPWRLTDTTVEHGRAYRDDLCHRRHLKANSVNHMLAGLRVFLEWAVAAGYLTRNPLRHVYAARNVSRSLRWLERAEQQRLVVTLEQTLARTTDAVARRQMIYERAIILLLLHTGIKVRELTRLTLDDVTLAEGRGVVRVRPTENRPRALPARELALNAEVRRALAAYLAVRPTGQGNRLFIGCRGGKLGDRYVRHILRKWTRAAGLPPEQVTCEVLRNTFGYNLVRAGVPLELVEQFMGRISLRALRSYATLQSVDLQQVVESIAIGAGCEKKTVGAGEEVRL
jgi:integrase/recombinase XerD